MCICCFQRYIVCKQILIVNAFTIEKAILCVYLRQQTTNTYTAIQYHTLSFSISISYVVEIFFVTQKKLFIHSKFTAKPHLNVIWIFCMWYSLPLKKHVNAKWNLYKGFSLIPTATLCQQKKYQFETNLSTEYSIQKNKSEHRQH